jgi:hypothetical protein
MLTLPPALGALTLSHAITGAEARAVVDRLHGRAVTPEMNRIGLYGDGKFQATLYGSLYPSAREAQGSLETMRRKIRTGEVPFTHAVDLERAGHPVGMCFGLGQVHFFLSDGRRLYWLAADPQVADALLDDLLRSLRTVR